MLEILNDGFCELFGGGVAPQVLGLHLSGLKHLVYALPHHLPVEVKAGVVQQISCAKQQGGGVCHVLADGFAEGVTRPRLKDDCVLAVALPGHQPGPADQPSGHVGDDITVEIRHHQDVKLLRLGDHLHAGVVDDHPLEFDVRIESGDLLAATEEEAVAELHDVGLVNRSHFLPIELGRVIESKLGNSVGLLGGDDLEALDNTLHRLMFQTRVLALGLLSNDDEVHVVVLAGDPRYAGHLDDICVQIQLLAHLNVEWFHALGGVGRGLQDPLQTQAVPGNGLDNGGDRHRLSRVNLAQKEDLEVHWNPSGLEDLLDGVHHLGADSVPGDEGGGHALFRSCHRRQVTTIQAEMHSLDIVAVGPGEQ